MRVLTPTRRADGEDSARSAGDGDPAVTAASRLRVVMHTRVVTGVGGGVATRPSRSLVTALTSSDDELEPPSFLRN